MFEHIVHHNRMSSQSPRDTYIKATTPSTSVNPLMMTGFNWYRTYSDMKSSPDKYPAVTPEEISNLTSIVRTHGMVCTAMSTAAIVAAFMLDKNVLGAKMGKMSANAQLGARAALYLGATFLGYRSACFVHQHPKEPTYMLYRKAQTNANADQAYDLRKTAGRN